MAFLFVSRISFLRGSGWAGAEVALVSFPLASPSFIARPLICLGEGQPAYHRYTFARASNVTDAVP